MKTQLQINYENKIVSIIRKLWRIATVPRSPDPDTARQEYISKVIITVLSLLSLSMTPLLLITYLIDPDRFSIVAPIQGITSSVLCVIGVYLAHKGYWYQVNLAIVLFLSLAGANDVLTYGLTSISYVEYSLSIALSVYLLKRKPQIFILILNVLSNSIMISLSDFSPEKVFNLRTAFVSYMIFTAVYYVTLFSLLTFFKREFNRSLVEVRKYSQRLKNQIKERRKVEKELIKSKLKAERSEKAKEELFTNMSHEIRTPLNAIVGFSELLSDTRLDREQSKYISNLKLASSNLLAIIGDVLDFSKASAGEISFENIEFSLNELIDSLVDFAKLHISEKKLEILKKTDKRIPDILIGDPYRLKQILANLVANAVKFTKMGSISISVTLLQNEKSTGKMLLEFSVKDTGIGIPDEKLEEIFESYKQADTSTSREYGGTGLGLAIVKKLTELQKGAISVESKVNKGSTFKVRLPFGAGRNNQTKQAIREGPKKGQTLENKKVLVVEDNLLNIMVVERMLKNLGCEITVCDTSQKAVDAAMVKRYDMILMDIQMPKLDGYAITKIIHSQKKGLNTKTPIVAMSAHALEKERQKAKIAGMKDYITKPFVQETLYKKISENL